MLWGEKLAPNSPHHDFSEVPKTTDHLSYVNIKVPKNLWCGEFGASLGIGPKGFWRKTFFLTRETMTLLKILTLRLFLKA